MSDFQSDGQVPVIVGEAPKLFENMETNVFYRIHFKDSEVYIGQVYFDSINGVYTATIHSGVKGHRTFQAEEVLSVTQLS
ncbi:MULTISPECIES: hypothetical protein [Pseudomonas]|uniref:hypothetical protein n=1 Tax=Pseudomonas TaxID=286 RepID=UPI001F4416EF|nr:hypothetical protein [Pseudomonas sputi]